MKKILLYAPSWIDLINLFEKNLIAAGFDVSRFEIIIPKFRYKNFSQRACNFLRKTFLNDHNYKKLLIKQHFATASKIIRTKYEYYDYALVIKADLLVLDDLLLIRKKTDCMVGYHFDGMNRNPAIFERVSIFDRFYVFDPSDIISFPEYSLLPCTNFFFDYPENPIAKRNQKSNNYKVYYLGTYHESRIKDILEVKQLFDKIRISNKIELIFYGDDKAKISPEMKKHFSCIHNLIPFEDYISRMKRADIILDFVLSHHNGLSYRIFEGIKYKKKVITTNKSVMLYDFYRPNNIFVLDHNYDELQIFLSLPYENVDDAVTNKYSFTNWIQYVLQIEPYERIGLTNNLK